MNLSEVHGPAHFLLVFELCAAAILAVFGAAQSLRAFEGSLWSRALRREVFSKLFLALFLSIVFYGQWLTGGREIAAVGIAMPGSLLTRTMVLDLPFWLRRLLEPSLWLLVLCLSVAVYDSATRRAALAFRWALRGALFLIFFESAVLAGGIRELLAMHPTLWSALVGLHFGLWQFLTIGLLIGILGTLSPIRRRDEMWNKGFVRKCVLSCVGVLLISLALCGLLDRVLHSSSPLRAGAHYYSWFPTNWEAGSLSERIKPSIEPTLGRYQSEDEAVFDQHVSWAKKAGLSFLVFDWWPKRPLIGKRIYHNVIRRKALDGLKFAIQYESLDLKEAGDKSFVGEEANVAFLTEQRAERLKKHWEYLAKHYMSDENYLRIEGRPVLFVYASRHLVGPVGKTIHEARRHVKERTGHSLYLVGDEVFFNVLQYSHRHGLLLQPEHKPNWDRVSAFDAITSYNPYDSSRKEHAGTAGAEQFLQDVGELYASYRGIAAAAAVRFIPGVLPGYNDRGVRLQEDHFAVPRRLESGRLFFEESIVRWAGQQLDRFNPMFVVTSWNEWNEATQIEPAAASPVSRQDDSPSGTDYTQGEEYWGYEELYLQTLAKELDALKTR